MSFDHAAAYNLGLTANRQLEAAESDSDTDNASGGVMVLDQLRYQTAKHSLTCSSETTAEPE